MTRLGAWIRKRKNLVLHPYRTIRWYRCEFTGEHAKLVRSNQGFDRIQRVDPHDRNEVYYMFHVYLTDPSVKIYLEYNDGTCREIKLGKIMKIKEE